MAAQHSVRLLAVTVFEWLISVFGGVQFRHRSVKSRGHVPAVASGAAALSLLYSHGKLTIERFAVNRPLLPRGRALLKHVVFVEPAPRLKVSYNLSSSPLVVIAGSWQGHIGIYWAACMRAGYQYPNYVFELTVGRCHGVY